MTCKKKSTKKSPAYGRVFKPNFSLNIKVDAPDRQLLDGLVVCRPKNDGLIKFEKSANLVL